jgi:hypothetical protein
LDVLVVLQFHSERNMLRKFILVCRHLSNVFESIAYGSDLIKSVEILPQNCEKWKFPSGMNFERNLPNSVSTGEIIEKVSELVPILPS